jgi:hypothetical protein
MNDVTRDRIWRKLQVLPEAQLYQVLDYIEFLESKYAPGRAVRVDPLQRFAERLEDGLRVRAVAPRLISGTVGIFGAARKVVQGVTDAGREILGEAPAPSRAPAGNAPTPPGELENGRPEPAA